MKRIDEGYTALQYAAMWGDLEATKWLIENGADVNTTDLGDQLH